MEVVRAHAEVGRELVEAAVDVDAGVARVVALPDRDRRPPETVPADRPVPRPFQPFAEGAVADVLGYPVDLLVELDHAVLEGRDAHEPRAHRPVDERRVGPPAVRVAVGVVLGLDERAGRPEALDDRRVGLEDLHTGVVGDLGGEPSRVVDRADDRDPGRLAGPLVVLAEARRHLDDAGALVDGDEVAAEHDEGARRVGEVGEERPVRPPDEVGALDGAEDLGALELVLVGAEAGLPDDEALLAQAAAPL